MRDLLPRFVGVLSVAVRQRLQGDCLSDLRRCDLGKNQPPHKNRATTVIRLCFALHI